MSADIKLTVTVHSVIDNLDAEGIPEGEPEINIFTTDGGLSLTEDGYILTFSERDENGTAHSEMHIGPDTVTLKKSGTLNSEMHFTEGKSHNSLYRVGPYSFDMRVLTKKIRNTVTADGGEVQLIYSMCIGGMNKNARMKITAKRK